MFNRYRPPEEYERGLQENLINYMPMGSVRSIAAQGAKRGMKSLRQAYNPEWIQEGAQAFQKEIDAYQRSMREEARKIAAERMLQKQQMLQRRQYVNNTNPERRSLDRIRAFISSRGGDSTIGF